MRKNHTVVSLFQDKMLTEHINKENSKNNDGFHKHKDMRSLADGAETCIRDSVGTRYVCRPQCAYYVILEFIPKLKQFNI